MLIVLHHANPTSNIGCKDIPTGIMTSLRILEQGAILLLVNRRATQNCKRMMTVVKDMESSNRKPTRSVVA